ncbi:MAG: hypothetical protein JO102_05540 [Elusimicrobia bacterium]|nr:hypothetical protein [Elusimicrobiota bacterium]
MKKTHRIIGSILLAISICFLCRPSAPAAIVVDQADPSFQAHVNQELDALRSGRRGIVCKTLIQRLDVATATTTIRPLTSDESTWHPNDPRGIRSHVEAVDTRIRGAERKTPTSAIVFIPPARVDPGMSVFRLGTFVHELSLAADLNDGVFSSDFKTREKRASFFRNAWLDALGLKPVEMSDRVPTPEYSRAKTAGLLNDSNAHAFPILDAGPAAVGASPTPTPK